jgi:hypothetical protein
MKCIVLMAYIVLGLVVESDALARGWGGGGYGGHYGGGHYGGGHYGGGYYRGGGVGVYFGPSFYSPYYYGYPGYYPYSPPVVVEPAPPPVYIEQGGQQINAEADWKYCAQPQGYYPHVQECRSGWQSVPQQPPGQQGNFWYFCSQPNGYYPYVRDCPSGWQQVSPQSNSDN